MPLGGGLWSRTEAARPPRPAPAGRRRRGRRSSITGAQARGPEGGSSRPVPLLPPPIPLQQPSQNPPTPPGTFRRMARPAGRGGLGAGRGAGVSRCLPSTRCGPGTARLPCPVHRVDSCLEKQRGARWSDLDRGRTRPLEGPGASVLGPAQCGDLECSPQAQGGLRAGPASDRTISPCHFPHVY